MKLLKVGEVVGAPQAVRRKLCESQGGGLCLVLGQRVGVLQLRQVAQHGGAGVDVGVGHAPLRPRSAACRHGFWLAKQIADGLASGETLRSLPKLLGLDLAVDPAIEDLGDGLAWFQAIGSHRPDGICGYVCP